MEGWTERLPAKSQALEGDPAQDDRAEKPEEEQEGEPAQRAQAELAHAKPLFAHPGDDRKDDPEDAQERHQTGRHHFAGPKERGQKLGGKQERNNPPERQANDHMAGQKKSRDEKEHAGKE